eukprot:13136548-Alexandrium_andersonii.AAC.1
MCSSTYPARSLAFAVAVAGESEVNQAVWEMLVRRARSPSGICGQCQNQGRVPPGKRPTPLFAIHCLRLALSLIHI